MSFGFGVSDLITVGALAWTVYKACRDSSEEFQRIAKEVKILHITIKETEELLEEYHWELSPSRRERLELIRESCEENLNELQDIVQKYERLATPSQRVFDQLRFGLQDVSELKQRIIATYTKLDAFNHILSNSSQRIIIKKLDKYRKEVRGGLHEGSVASTASAESIGTKEVWEGFRRELETIGISKSVINENQDFITGWFRDSFARGELEEDVPPETLDTGPAPSLLSGPTAVTGADSFRSPSTTAVDSTAESITFDNPFDKYFEKLAPTASATSSGSRTSPGGSARKKSSRLGSIMFKLFKSDAMLLEAASEGDTDKVADLIRKGANVNVKDRWGWAPMSMAAYGGYPEIAKLLMEAGADLDYQDVDGDTPLDLATNKGHTPVVLLIQEEITRRTVENG